MVGARKCAASISSFLSAFMQKKRTFISASHRAWAIPTRSCLVVSSQFSGLKNIRDLIVLFLLACSVEEFIADPQRPGYCNALRVVYSAQK